MHSTNQRSNSLLIGYCKPHTKHQLPLTMTIVWLTISYPTGPQVHVANIYAKVNIIWKKRGNHKNKHRNIMQNWALLLAYGFVQGSDWYCDRDVIWSVRYGQRHFQYPHPPGHTDPGILASSSARNAYSLGHSYTMKNEHHVRGMGRENLANLITPLHWSVHCHV